MSILQQFIFRKYCGYINKIFCVVKIYFFFISLKALQNIKHQT